MVLLEPPDQEPESEEFDTPASFTELKWLLPEEFVMNTETGELGNVGDRIEVFRFFPDGSASGVREFRLQFRDWSRVMTISPLTGRLMVEEGIAF